MRPAGSSETLVSIYQNTRRNTSEHCNLQIIHYFQGTLSKLQIQIEAAQPCPAVKSPKPRLEAHQDTWGMFLYGPQWLAACGHQWPFIALGALLICLILLSPFVEPELNRGHQHSATVSSHLQCVVHAERTLRIEAILQSEVSYSAP
jgi:hypothetical protein